jgi:F-type H+-transporting ATPase subunit b
MPGPASAAAPAGSGGLPQFDMAQWPGQVVWALVIFGLLYLLFFKVLVPRLGGTIADREARIGGDIAEARRMKDEAQAASEDAARDLGEARARARKVAQAAAEEVKSAAAARAGEEDAKLAQVLAAAEARIAEARAEAMGHVRTIAIDAAGAMVERLTGVAAAAGEVEQAMIGHG